MSVIGRSQLYRVTQKTCHFNVRHIGKMLTDFQQSHIITKYGMT